MLTVNQYRSSFSCRWRRRDALHSCLQKAQSVDGMDGCCSGCPQDEKPQGNLLLCLNAYSYPCLPVSYLVLLSASLDLWGLLLVIDAIRRWIVSSRFARVRCSKATSISYQRRRRGGRRTSATSFSCVCSRMHIRRKRELFFGGGDCFKVHNLSPYPIADQLLYFKKRNEAKGRTVPAGSIDLDA